MRCHDSIQVIIQLFYLRLSNIVLTNYSKQGQDPAAFYRVPTIAKLCRQEGIGWVVVSRNNIWRFLHFYVHDEWLYEVKRKPPKINRRVIAAVEQQMLRQ